MDRADGGQRGISVRERCNGRELVRDQGPNLLRVLRDAAPTVLAFDIPVQSDPAKPPLAQPSPASPFEVFMRLGMSPRGKPEALGLARLPTRAPTTVACLGT